MSVVWEKVDLYDEETTDDGYTAHYKVIPTRATFKQSNTDLAKVAAGPGVDLETVTIPLKDITMHGDFICTGVSASPLKAPSRRGYKVTATFGIPGEDDDIERDDQGNIIFPWDEKPKISGGEQTKQVFKKIDARGSAIIVSSKEAIAQHPGTTVILDAVTISRVSKADGEGARDAPALARALRNKTNAAVITIAGMEYAIDTALCRYIWQKDKFEWEEEDSENPGQKIKNSQSIYRETITIIYDEDTWVTPLFDEGYHTWRETLADAPPGDNRLGLIPIVDADGVKVSSPQPLNGNAQELRKVDYAAGGPHTLPNVNTDLSSNEGVFLDYWFYKNGDFSTLELPEAMTGYA